MTLVDQAFDGQSIGLCLPSLAEREVTNEAIIKNRQAAIHPFIAIGERD